MQNIKVLSYNPVSNERRKELLRLVNEEYMSIRQAALRCNISYPTAKAINRTFKEEGRFEKKTVRAKRSKVPKVAREQKLNEKMATATPTRESNPR